MHHHKTHLRHVQAKRLDERVQASFRRSVGVSRAGGVGGYGAHARAHDDYFCSGGEGASGEAKVWEQSADEQERADDVDG